MKTHILAAFALVSTLSLSGQSLNSVPSDSQPAAPVAAVEAAPVETPAVRVDTVFLLKDSVLAGMVKGWQNRIEKSRRQGYGGAGGWTPMVMAVDMAPVRDQLLNDVRVRDYKFDLSRAAMMAGSGGMGYGGIGNGIRIGGAGYGGSQRFTSLTGAGDSLMRLNVEVDFGGLLVEKAFVRDHFNWLAGGLIGGGSYTVTRHTYRSSDPSAFDLDLSKGNSGPSASADFTCLGVYGGFTYTMVSWFHVGADAGLTAFYSNSGFGGNNESFFAGNGAVRLRLIWGNLG